jgi:hypothetical protein
MYGRNTAAYTVMYCIVSVRSLVFVQCTRIRLWYQWPHFRAVIILATLRIVYIPPLEVLPKLQELKSLNSLNAKTISEVK